MIESWYIKPEPWYIMLLCVDKELVELLRLGLLQIFIGILSGCKPLRDKILYDGINSFWVIDSVASSF